MMKLAPEVAEDLVRMEWAFLCAPEGESFVTTDSPFLITPPLDWPKTPLGLSGAGLRIKGARKWLPLSASTCLVMFDPGFLITYREISRETLLEINRAQAAHAYRLMIARDEALLRGLVQEMKAKEKWGGSKLVMS
jgi:hypothetical protein